MTDTHRLKVKGRQIYNMQIKRKKKAGVVILTPHKIDLKTKVIVRNKKRHYIMMKGTFRQKDITLENIYAPSTRETKYVKQILRDIKGYIGRNAVIVGNFNTLLTLMDRSSRHKINKEIVTLNDTVDHIDLIHIFREFHFKREECTSFSSTTTC
ncbi:hypothetical protein HJG60_010002 [Phyllostomus discolor]|uniref:Craniofacial development protein 2-like n=1 Tax=Phyllostomus discolor TaxID=89673 RepID=A0A833YEF2_9CHIR|nr:hypothetical protein HJG60_010002 [Phyllostomus discolor]